MEKFVEQTLLYDFYGELLTEHQQRIYKDAVFYDLSISEIASNEGISRQGIHDLIKRCNRQLAEYESRLHLMERFLKLKGSIYEIQAYAKGEKGLTADERFKKIESLSSEILEEL